jgi:hypothetical protein
MKIRKSNILIGFIIMLCLAFAVLEFQQMYLLSEKFKSLIVPLFTLLYFVTVKRRSFYFTWFLILFSVSELIVFTELFFDFDVMTEQEYLNFNKVYYTLGNALYIFGYVFLLIEILNTIEIKNVWKNYKIHLIVLSALNIYIVYVLLTIVSSDNDPEMQLSTFEMTIELIYNIAMLLVLTASLISYFYNDNKKSLLLFFGAICIVFSEVIQVAYFYISDKDLLNLLQTLLFVLAFSFFYFQSKIRNKKVQFFA